MTRRGAGTAGRHVRWLLLLGLLTSLTACAGRDMSWDSESGSFSLPLESTDPPKDKEIKRDPNAGYANPRE